MWRACRRLFSTFYTVTTPAGVGHVRLLQAPAYLGHSSDRNIRSTNEDRLFAGVLHIPSLEGIMRDVLCVGVFDGHGGPECAEFLKESLAGYVENAPHDGDAIASNYKRTFGGYWRAWKSSLLRYDRKLSSSHYDDFARRLPLSFLQADYDFLTTKNESGSTCTAAFIYTLDPGEHFWQTGTCANMTVAQVGDSRAIISDNRGNIQSLTTVHHPDSTLESDRLGAFNGDIWKSSDGTNRFMQYANTRAFGDAQAKARGISAEPDLTLYDLGRGRGRLPGEEAFLVLVTDGITDVASDQEMVDLVIQTSIRWGAKGTPQRAADELVRYASAIGSQDNATALVLRFGGWGRWEGWTDRSGQQRADRMMNWRRQ